ncbi:MAG: chloride channel protein [Gammaproteobacteria bacterium]|jgi:H+/Cl- antiporter ClcA|nr:chloride channel protein [Gammaproteobacteria bacterium]
MDHDYAASLRLTLLGAVSGLLAALVVLAFRSVIEWGQWLLLPAASGDGYEVLSPAARLALPLAAGLLLGIAFDLLPRHRREVGVNHVLKRLQAPGRERLPLVNMLVQFFGAVVAIVGGHSVDREGPAVHLGAGSASFVGSWLGLDAEEERTLLAAGAAAAIAAAFDTPLAGVVFSIEVLRIRYQVTRFLPVIVAAVMGAMASRVLSLDDPGFPVVPEHLGSHWEILAMLALGGGIGLLAVAFSTLAVRLLRTTGRWPCSLTFSLAGLITGLLALWTPQIMGISYDTLAIMLLGEAQLVLVLPLVATKLIATAVSIGLRVPGGLIGPTLFIGGAAGSTLGLLLAAAGIEQAASAGFYATIGMAAMMGATLRAPLAALTALLELTANPNIILPGMLAVATAELVSRAWRGERSVFDLLLNAQPIDTRKS